VESNTSPDSSFEIFFEHLISSCKVFDAFGFEAGEDLTGTGRDLRR
jgi:hypothetical protein